MTAKISACLIVRDDSSTLEACLQSIRPHVAEICIVDTGSVDASPEIARRYADKFEVFLDCNDAEGRIEDFALARNRSFAIATGDVAFWLDGDDVVRGAEHLQPIADELVRHETGQILLPYEYSFDEANRCTLLQYRERLLYPRVRWDWRFPVHESCLLGAGPELAYQDRSELVRLVHRHRESTRQREPDRNLRILKNYITRVGESDERSLYYLGAEYGLKAMRCYGANDTLGFLENTGNSLRVLKRYVQLSRWEDEKALAQLELCRHYQRINDHGEAIKWALDATVTKSWPEPYFCLMNSYYSLSQQEKQHERYHMKRAAHFGQIGMSLQPRDVAQTLLAQNPTYKFQATEVLAACQAGIGDLDGAIQTLEFGCSGLPENQQMAANLRGMRLERSRRALLNHARELAMNNAIGDGGETIIKGVVNGDFSVQLLGAPTDMPGGDAGSGVPAAGSGAELAAVHPIDSGSAAAASGKLDLIFFVGHGLEPWNGKTIERTGMGGSETMAWELARRLAKRGHAVRLVGHCSPAAPASIFDGVRFIDQNEFFSRPQSCDVLISSRRPEIVDDGARITAGARLLWVHDVHCGDRLTHKRNIRFDRILALTNWHKSFLQRCYPLVDTSKILVTRNGIDLTRFEGKETRNARRAIYSSSPDRGLEQLLDIWPVVRKSIPDAELHVFYGFESWRATVKMLGADDANELKRIEFLEAKIKRTPGVTLRGRVSQRELAREFMKSGVWAYPTGFTETSCITAMEAQAAGCRIVTSPLAALNETVAERGQLVAGFSTPGFVEAFASAVVMAMTETLSARAVDDRVMLQAYARNHFSLDDLAVDFESIATDTLSDVKQRVVPAFHNSVVV